MKIKSSSVSAFWSGKDLSEGLKEVEVNKHLQVTGLVPKRLQQQKGQVLTLEIKLTACFIAGIGPIPIMEGSTPACDQETICARGVSPRLSASDFFIRTTAAAPSFIPVKYECLNFQNIAKLHTCVYFLQHLKTWVKLIPFDKMI